LLLLWIDGRRPFFFFLSLILYDDTHQKEWWRHWTKSYVVAETFPNFEWWQKVWACPNWGSYFCSLPPPLRFHFVLLGGRARPCLIHHHHLIRYL
jgi:hypothetical protein